MYDYDDNGNRNGRFLTWDYENRLTGAESGYSEQYVYDALGRRVSATVTSNAHIRNWTTTNFTYEGQDVLMDDTTSSSQSGSALTKYLNGPGIDNKVGQTNDDGSQYFIADHLGSTNALTDATGNQTASNSYDSFGNPTNQSFPTRYQFTGREFDQNTGLQFSRARWYDPNIGRFISEDPIGFSGGDINQYVYVKNAPLSWKDPRGLDLVGVTGGASLWGGPVIGAGTTGSYAVGYGSDGLGSSASYGYFYGPGHSASDTGRHSGWAVGLGAGIGVGGFWTNADKWCELAGDFETTLFGLGPLGSIEIDKGDNNVYAVQVYPGPTGKGSSIGITHFRTNTPSTGKFSDTVDDISRKFRTGIRDIYGY